MLRVKEPERHAQRATLRAAWRLDGLGLIECCKPFYGNKVFVILTELGAEIVDRHRHALVDGQRIRWPREEG
jgi:hypothetical protein